MNKISKGQFYYYKRKYSSTNETRFHSIDIKDVKNYIADSDIDKAAIKLDIGKARLHIPQEIAGIALESVIKESGGTRYL